MDGWEYLTRVFDFRPESVLGGKYGDGSFDAASFDHEANALGWDGWELVSIIDTNRFKGATAYVVATFKRPLTPERREEVQAATKPAPPS